MPQPARGAPRPSAPRVADEQRSVATDRQRSAHAPEVDWQQRWDEVVYGQAPPGPGRCNHAAAAVGTVAYFFGGHDGVSEHTSDSSVCAVQTRPSTVWESIRQPRQPGQQGKSGLVRSQLCACSVNGRVYLIGGWDGERRGHPVTVYDPEESTLEEITTGGESPCQYSFAAAVSVHTRIVVFGGCARKQENKIYMLDVQGGGDLVWVTSSYGQVPSKRSSHAMAAAGQRVFMFGGRDAESKPLGDLHCFEVDTSTSSATASQWSAPPVVGGEPPQPRYGHAMAAVGTTIFLHGGMAGARKMLGDLFRLETAAAQPVWEAVPIDGPSPAPRAYHVMVAADSVLCVFGGRGAIAGLALGDLWTIETTRGSSQDFADDPETALPEGVD
eukprot:TRINITY_DN10987_c0_g1_i1.p1 TRINITY_DN10987_c0_g1~~TRINITY_DN10987_c0_g1_i1.p1  ORF type:complete len:385 (+),score=78.06 TRINITY_DN10987_c0_g1_i1:93-1247(+)